MKQFQRKLSGKSERDEGDMDGLAFCILLLNIAWESTGQLRCWEHSEHTRSPAGLRSSLALMAATPLEIPEAA